MPTQAQTPCAALSATARPPPPLGSPLLARSLTRVHVHTPLADDLNAPLLSPALAVPPPPSTESGSPASHAAQLALVLEAEHDLRTVDRELREVQVLDERDVAGAGKLGGASGSSCQRWGTRAAC